MPNTAAETFSTYWKKKRLLETNTPTFPVAHWDNQNRLSEIENIYYHTLKNAKTVLDVGAGDLRVKKRFENAGYCGHYDTLDYSFEFPHTFKHIDEVSKKYDAVLCLDVIEHMSLTEGLSLMEKMLAVTNDNGFLILQTPNSRCVRNPLASDVTHVQGYNLLDLWAHFTTLGHDVHGYRVVLGKPKGVIQKLESLLSRYIITRLLGLDYADNIAIIVQKKENSEGAIDSLD